MGTAQTNQFRSAQHAQAGDVTLFSSLTVPAFPEVAAETASKTVLTGVMKTCATIRFRIGVLEKLKNVFVLRLLSK